MYERTVDYMSWSAFNRLMETKDVVFYEDCIEGVLLDSLVVVTKDGIYFAYEHYVNSNMSDLMVVFIPISAENWDELIDAEWNTWDKLKGDCE